MGLGRREGGRAPNWPLSREEGGREDESGGPPNLRCVRGPRSIRWLVRPVMAREPAIVLREECEIKGFVAAVVPRYIYIHPLFSAMFRIFLVKGTDLCAERKSLMEIQGQFQEFLPVPVGQEDFICPIRKEQKTAISCTSPDQSPL